jgi:hypothetical protein
VTVSSTSFSNDISPGAYGPVQVLWTTTRPAADGVSREAVVLRTLGTLSERTSFTPPSASLNKDKETSTFSLKVAVPADATDRPASDPYSITMFQNRPTGDGYTSGSVVVHVDGPPMPKENLGGEGQNLANFLNQGSVQNTVGGNTSTGPALVNGAPAPAVAGDLQLQAGAQGQAAAATAPVAGAPGTAVAPGVPSTAPATAADPSRPALAPVTLELWSGLNQPTSTTSLLDAPAPASSGNEFPAGAVLLGAGLLALAGSAALAGQRRLALARTR